MKKPNGVEILVTEPGFRGKGNEPVLTTLGAVDSVREDSVVFLESNLTETTLTIIYDDGTATNRKLAENEPVLFPRMPRSAEIIVLYFLGKERSEARGSFVMKVHSKVDNPQLVCFNEQGAAKAA